MRELPYEVERIPCYIRLDQAKRIERIKYEGRMEKDMKIPKAEIIRTALDALFEMSIEEILELLSKRANELQ